MNVQNNQPTAPFIMMSWAALAVGLGGFLIGLWNSGIGMEEKGFYFTVMAFSMFSAVSVQKSVRDRIEGIPVSDMYYGICWFGIILSVLLLVAGLFNATTIDLSQKGFYAMAYTLCIFASITVQKNTRDQVKTTMQFPETQFPVTQAAGLPSKDS
ncbi:inner membrane protein YiaA [Mariniblastus sp.]|jgi:uncharacterized membrane protein YiaA|nr:inner membrane protein YiaA [Mariniblastus sp.]MDB4756404.1 inner membrane protein YiaA [Mariniblastus sp.]